MNNYNSCVLFVMNSDMKATHHLSNTSIYNIWSSMKQRCTNPNCKHYDRYGGRGIKIEWKNFDEFYRDMGGTYKGGLSIDRIDNDGNYCKENCRWATMKEQNNNKSSNTKAKYGEDFRDIIKEKGCSMSFFKKCMRNSGYKLDKAKELVKDKNEFNPTKNMYKGKTAYQWAKEFGYTCSSGVYYMMEKHNLSLGEYVEGVLAGDIHRGTNYYRSIGEKQHRQTDDTILTDGQRKIYEYYKNNGGSSYAIDSKELGISSTVLFNYVKVLERKGYVKRENGKVLII